MVPFSSSAKKYGSYGGGSSYSSGSKPSGSSYNSKPGPSPTNSNSKPSSGGGQYGPTYSTEKSYNNPNPAYKPATPAGAPTLASGGGGYNSRGGGGYSGTSLAGAAVGGTFFSLRRMMKNVVWCLGALVLPLYLGASTSTTQRHYFVLVGLFSFSVVII